MKDVTMKRDTNIGLTSVESGHFEIFRETKLNNDNLPLVLKAGLSNPGVFPTTEIEWKTYFPGQLVWAVDIFSAIERCMEKGAKEEEIIVDTFLTWTPHIQHVNAEDYTAFEMLYRYTVINAHYEHMDGILRARRAFPNVNYRYTIQPSGDLPESTFPLINDP